MGLRPKVTRAGARNIPSSLLGEKVTRRRQKSAPPPTARKGECEGETFAGFPTRVQSPARRRPLLRSKSAAPKKKDTHVGVFLFWSGRRGSNSLPGIPRMADAIRRNPASPLDLTRSAPVEAASSSSPSVKFQKKTPSFWMGSSFGAGDEARTRYLDLGKVALYQMSYARKRKVNYTAYFPVCQPCIFILRIL